MSEVTRERRREGEDKPEGDGLTEEQQLQQEHARETADVQAEDAPATTPDEPAEAPAAEPRTKDKDEPAA